MPCNQKGRAYLPPTVVELVLHCIRLLLDLYVVHGLWTSEILDKGMSDRI